MRYHQPQGHFRYFTTQLRESDQNYQDCQTPSLSRQSILQAAGLSQNPDSKKSKMQKKRKQTGPIIREFALLHHSSYMEIVKKDIGKKMREARGEEN